MRRRGPIVALVSASALALASCGFGSGDTTTVTGGAPDPVALTQLRDCLREHGIDAPEPGQSPPSLDTGKAARKAQKAMQTCGQYAPQGGPPTQALP